MKVLINWFNIATYIGLIYYSTIRPNKRPNKKTVLLQPKLAIKDLVDLLHN